MVGLPGAWEQSSAALYTSLLAHLREKPSQAALLEAV